MNVLIAEDNANDRKMLSCTLEHYGCTVINAKNGQEGLDLAKRHKPDFIVSDALMPGMDGFQFLRALKADPELSSIPFLFYSAVYTGEAEEKLALSLGAAAFVVKPTEPEELWEKINGIMELCKNGHSATHHSIGEDEENLLHEYGRIVATKLEEKVCELEEALAQRKQAETDLRILNEELNREITERRRAENSLVEQEQELATIFENTSFFMLLLDGDRRVRRLNGLACKYTGSTVSDMLGRRTGNVLHCLHALESSEGCGFAQCCQECVLLRAVVDTYETGQSYQHVETKMSISVDGKEQIITFLISTSRVMVAHQAMVLLSLQDISEYKNLESQLLHAQKMESIGTLAGGIAHDFNNILTVILGYGDIALMSMDADDPHRQDVEYILEAAHRAASLAQDLLLFSRKQISDKNNTDLNMIVKSVDKFLRRVIGEDVACTITLSDEPIPIFADSHQIEQVLMNLATNARDAMPEGGSLSISTGRIQLDEEFITAHGYGSIGMYAGLTVADNGLGMTDETCLRIFDPFFTTKEIGKGTGLGMSVVYGIVKQHDGFITVYSKPGLGSTFRIYLPLILDPADEATVDSINKKPVGGTETILLAEDDETIRNMALSQLRVFGYEVIVAIDGEDAVQKYLENRGRIRLLLFDVIMPGKSGINAYDEIRKIDPGMKVIFSSGYATDTIRQKALDSDNVVLLSKPYLPTKLLEMVRSVLDSGRS
ncbi:MAG: response regulator [Desulfuromonadaceae bacterium]|nr:response regulator [Desulfuromonadaceae bacterium]MDD5107618.1 response regulator [Desulfuromonadaceae bacterium]